MFWNEGEEEKGTLGIPMKNMLDGPSLCDDVDGITTQPLGDIGVDEPKFNGPTGAIDMLGMGALTDEGETPLTINAEVGVYISTRPSPEIDITTLKGTQTIGIPNEQTCTKTRYLRLVRGEL